jgi:hypothetical protein
MPLPPIHGLVALVPYFKNKARLDPLALVAGATFVDLESLVYILLGNPVDHQMWHGYAVGLTVYPILVALFVYSMERLLEGNVQSAYHILGFRTNRVKYPPLTIYLCCLAGAFSHLFFDMFTHPDLPYIIYPLRTGNPFYIGQYSGIVELVTIALAAVSIFLWWKNAKTPKHPQTTRGQ